MLYRLRQNSVRLLILLIPALCALAHSGVARADVKGIPYNDRFQAAAYPYARVVTGCTSWRRPERMSDAWSDVSFAGACSLLDRCFHTLGATWSGCNQRFRGDLRASCDRDLERGRLMAGQRGTPDPQALRLCHQIAELYAARAGEADTESRFAVAQHQEAAYLRYVQAVVNDIYVSVLRRKATRPETSRALATLTKDYSLDDLKAALMGNRMDSEGQEALPGLDDRGPALLGLADGAD